MAKQYKTHSAVPKKYKWDLTFLLDGKTPEEAINAVLKDFRKELKIKDSKYDSPEAYLKYLKANEKMAENYFKLSNYISNSTSLNVADPVPAALAQKFQFGMYEINKEMGSEDVRFFKNSAKLAKWAKLPKFKEHKHSIETKLEEKKFQLPKAIQEFRIKESRADIDAEAPFSILTNTELDYGFATTTGGKKIKVTPANRNALSKHKDAKVRKTASISYMSAYLKHKGTLSNLLFQHKKSESTFALIEGHKSAIDGLIFDDRSSRELLENLFSSVQDSLGTLKKFQGAHKKFYKAKFGKTMTKYDGNVELINADLKVTADQAMKDVAGALKPFGKEYHDVVKDAFKNNWVDFMPVVNKRSGAYSIGATYGIDKKLILMNFDETIDATSTLAHEMGHSMHSYFSDKYNSLTNAQYKIFVAEIASIFNELMYYDYLLKNTDDDKLKFKINGEIVSGFIGTVHRQIEWANYELDVYDQIDKGTPLGTYEALSKVYLDNHTKYSTKKNPKYTELDAVPAIYVPHFYYGFYVYKYAVGQLVANIFFKKYKEQGAPALQEYIDNFLKAGGSKNPLDILKDAGVDLLDPKTTELGFKAFEDNVNEYIRLGNKLFKK